MKYLIMLLLVVGCTNRYIGKVERKDGTCTIQDNTIICDDGTSIEVPGPQHPENEVDLSQTIIAKDSCVKIADNVYIQNIQSGIFFDVNTNDTCTDSLGEYCDNVETAFGVSGSGGQGAPGAARVCWVGTMQLSGVKQTNGDILLYMVEFH